MEPKVGGGFAGEHLPVLLGETYKEAQGEAKYARFVAYERGKIDIHSSEEQEPAWQAFVEGMERLQKKFGTLDVAWGKINVVVRNGVFPMDGTSVELFGVLHPGRGTGAG